MTDQVPATGAPDGDIREALRRAAAAHSAASGDVETFIRRVPEVPGAADVAEYGSLVAREESLRAQRQDAADAAGLSLPSVESP